MSDTCNDPIFEAPLVIKVQDFRPHYCNPPGALNSDLYSVNDEGNLVGVTGWQDRSRVTRIPRVLLFEAEVPITAVGFSECANQIEEYKWRGPCGGCFFLTADLTGKETSVSVENWGHQRKQKRCRTYHFALWLNHKRHAQELDPQIYNEVEPPPGDGEHDGKRTSRLLRRFAGWLKR